MNVNPTEPAVAETTTVATPQEKSVKKGKTAKKAPKSTTKGKSMKNAPKTVAKAVTRKTKPKDVITTVTLRKGEIPPEGYTRVRETRRGVTYQKVKKAVTNSNMNSLANEFAKISGLGKEAAMVAHEAGEAAEAVNEVANNENSLGKLAKLFGKATLSNSKSKRKAKK